jgi:hypothetical protein
MRTTDPVEAERARSASIAALADLRAKCKSYIRVRVSKWKYNPEPRPKLSRVEAIKRRNRLYRQWI